jgi:hypothetical protein
MLIYFRVFVEWPKTRTIWNLKNYGFSICIDSITGWTGWNDFVAIVTSSVMETTGSTDTRGSTWLLLIT